jgi:hypothetical protein
LVRLTHLPVSENPADRVLGRREDLHGVRDLEPAGTPEGMMSLKLFTAGNAPLSQRKPKKSNLNKQDLVLSSWTGWSPRQLYLFDFLFCQPRSPARRVHQQIRSHVIIQSKAVPNLMRDHPRIQCFAGIFAQAVRFASKTTEW